jgi:DNA polymerase-3 subunit alpha
MIDNRFFTHLHLHTDYSLLDGAITIDRLVEYGLKHKIPALGISDHGNVFAALKFFQKCKKAKIKPILGMEAYTIDDIASKDINNRYHHLMLIVKNEIGYRNLCKLISHSYRDGFYFKPRIDYKLLKQYSAGLIVSSACLGGHIPQLLLGKKEQEARERIDWFQELFGEDFYLEIQPPDQAEQIMVNEQLCAIAKEKNIQLLASADCHYLLKEDRQAHDVLLSIQTHDTIDNPKRFSFGECQAYMRSQEEMLELFKDHQEAVWASGEITKKCNFEFETGKLFFPKSPIPENETEESFFDKQCHSGLQFLVNDGRIPEHLLPQYKERLELEIFLIKKMGFIGYFLVVSDFIQWARSQDIPVGPGRGSAAGSLVAWSLRITDIDPIKYNLLFERFLNPERVSMPDIDIDFCIEGRERVIQYVRDKYNADNVCQIITFGTMMAKGVIKDVARALGVSFDEAQALSDLIPDQLKITLEEAFKQEPELERMRQSNPKIAQVFDIAFKLEGLTRHASKHAAGIVISPKPIDEVLPVYIPPKTTDLVAQYTMNDLEALGFLKMDFLGLKNLTLVRNVCNLLKKTFGTTIRIEHIPIDDQATYESISRGNTSGVFQLESDGLKDVLRRLQPKVFEDIIAVNALYRPGPLGSGMVDDFIKRKHGEAEITYLFPELKPILEETYGVIVYQEQVMKIASAIGGYSLGEADILRRAMGKKKADVMAEQKNIFTSGAASRNFDPQKAGEVFDLMAYFAGYGFNKSHSAAYALIAYQTAYLKTHYTAEFMACLISLESSDPEKQAFYIQEAKENGIAILPPNINTSQRQFSVENKAIRFGLQGIKHVGEAALENIEKQRLVKNFEDIADFCIRMDLRSCNKRVIESLIYAGAFDNFIGTRAQKIAILSHVMDLATEYKKTQATGQMGLFGSFAPKAEAGQKISYTMPDTKDFSLEETLGFEKDVLGLYVSAHPSDAYQKELSWLAINPFSHISGEQTKNNTTVICAGSIINYKVIVTKKGDKMAFLSCEDRTNKAEIIAFPKVYTTLQQYLDNYSYFIIIGDTDNTKTTCKIKASLCIPCEELFGSCAQAFESVTITFPQTKHIQKEELLSLKELFSVGTTAVHINFFEQNIMQSLKTRLKIALSKELLLTIEERFQASIHLSLKSQKFTRPLAQ